MHAVHIYAGVYTYMPCNAMHFLIGRLPDWEVTVRSVTGHVFYIPPSHSCNAAVVSCCLLCTRYTLLHLLL